MPSDGKKEFRKLRANYVNGLAISFFVIGAGTPFFNAMARNGITAWEIVLAATATLLSFSIHSLACHYVREMDLDA